MLFRSVAVKMAETVEKDAHGNVQLSGTGALGDLLSSQIKKNSDIKRVRSDTFGYLQRCFMGCVSDVDMKEARKAGEKAVQYAIGDNLDGSVTIHRTGDYSVDYKLTDLKEIAAKTKLMPEKFIDLENNHITNAFRTYLRPLLGSDFPQAHRIQAPKADKMLNK